MNRFVPVVLSALVMVLGPALAAAQGVSANARDNAARAARVTVPKACKRLNGQERRDCLQQVRSKDSKKKRKAGTVAASGAAVQNQSARVSDTGVAPPAVAQRTPGRRPAVDAKP